MNIIKALFGLFRKAFSRAEKYGLTDEVIKLALKWVEEAGSREGDNGSKREYVVAILVKRGVPESIARLAVEVAVQIWKQKAGK